MSTLKEKIITLEGEIILKNIELHKLKQSDMEHFYVGDRVALRLPLTFPTNDLKFEAGDQFLIEITGIESCKLQGLSDYVKSEYLIKVAVGSSLP